VALTATVVANTSGFGTPTGSIDFKNGTTDLGTVALNTSGVAVLNTASLPTGANSIKAIYSGDTVFSTSTSIATTVTIAKAATTTSLSASPNPSTRGKPVTLTAVVTATSPGAGSPTGSVEFFSGTTDLGSGVLTNGVATFQTSNIPVGTITL